MSDKKKEIPKNQRDMSSMQKKAQMQTLKQVMRYLGKYKIFLVFSIILAAVSVALTLYIPKLTGHAVDYIVSKGNVNFAWCI